ncbi:Solute carrier organic anion transporter family member 1A5 [Nymphon striatum]|nr:Solute carrier organic anion transporter family member 1A5 [Nymphon striatum]
METFEMETKVKEPGDLRLLWQKIRHNKIIFFIVYCLAGLHTMSLWGYLPSILTTLEKLLGFPTQIVSLIFVIGDISTFLFSIFLSYYGGNKHRPRMIAVGLFVWGAVMISLALPQAIFGSKEIAKNMNGRVLNSTSLNNQFELVCTEARNETCNENIETFETTSVITCFILCLGIFISNAGAVICLNIGASYVDDNFAAGTTALFIGFFAVARQIGYICGIFYAAIFLSYYQDPTVDPGFDESDPRWIGAWWIGFVVMGIQCILVGMLIGTVPKNLNVLRSKKPDLSKDVTELAIAKGVKEENLWKDLPARLANICKNKVFVANMLSSSFAMLGLYGSVLMLPKTLEVMFYLTPSEANTYTGYINIASFSIGFIGAGIVTRVFKPSPIKLAVFMTISFILNAALTFSISGITCGNPDIKTEIMASEPQCIHTCDCNNFQFNPICDLDMGITYFSPCHANCKEHTSESGTEIFKQCGCNVTKLEDGNVKIYSKEFNRTQKGVCRQECKQEFAIFVVLLAFVYTIWASTTIITLIISLRSVSKIDKSLGQGVGLSCLTIIAFIPTPILFSMAIDNSCKTWNESGCNKNSTYCLNYDYSSFRDSIHILAASAYLVAAAFSAFTSFHIRKIKDFYNED